MTTSPIHFERAYNFGGDPDWHQLSQRMGEECLRRRIEIQNLHYTSLLTRSRRYLSRQLIKNAAEWTFRLSGLYALGHRQFRAVRVVTRVHNLPRLPPPLNGMRILQLSDLHLDLDPGLAEVVADRLSGLEYDLAVLTGDFRNSTYGDFHPALVHTRRVVESLTAPPYGVLGNHDYLEMAPKLEEMGVRMLLNESIPVTVRRISFFLAGVDDAHLYRTHDTARAAANIPRNAFSIFLSHAPEAYDEAARAGFDFFLCGHTHGGQICLPGGIPIITHCRAPRWCARGSWTWKGMRGYTTTGTGGCGAALRLNCPPEIVLHELRGIT
ncbi:MAG: metallophosphoesterase [Candidatus Methylacidiphilales bacterium]